MCYVQFGAYPNHMHMQIILKNNLKIKKEINTEKKNITAQIGDYC
jgi:hypothetical protein